MKLPQRSKEHVLEEVSRRYFEKNLPEHWTSEQLKHDYGIDLKINIFIDSDASPYELFIQLKASQKKGNSETETIRLKVSTYNYLKNYLHVVMLVKYVADDDEAYWSLLVDCVPPNQNAKTFTIRISKKSKLSQINWKEIEKYIKNIVDYKLNAGDVIRQRRQTNNNE